MLVIFLDLYSDGKVTIIQLYSFIPTISYNKSFCIFYSSILYKILLLNFFNILFIIHECKTCFQIESYEQKKIIQANNFILNYCFSLFPFRFWVKFSTSWSYITLHYITLFVTAC
jgi:hypothetical protein